MICSESYDAHLPPAADVLLSPVLATPSGGVRMYTAYAALSHRPSVLMRLPLSGNYGPHREHSCGPSPLEPS